MTSQGLTVRRIEPDDWRLWREVRLRALATDPSAFGSSLADWQGTGDREARWRRRLLDVPFNVVAIEDGATAGQASGSRVDADGVSELTSMWVDPRFRRRRVGDALIDEVEGWARTSGASSLRLSVRATNHVAIALYERHGFEASGRPGDDDAELEMALHLGP
jgi:ribosomal protein S18 acetylase RimI-like enzyme